MNCKPGDLAFIIRAKHSENIGKIVRVVEPSPYPMKRPAWTVEFERDGFGITHLSRIESKGKFVVICDDCLRPIRPEPETQPAPPQEVTA